MNILFQSIGTDPRDDRENLTQRKGTRVCGTCEWIKSDELYINWLHSQSGLLWLSGAPGKGKTMLSIFLAEELERIAKDLPQAVFLEFFCDNNNERRNTADGIVRGLLFQLLQSHPDLMDCVLRAFDIQEASLFTNSSSLWKIFKTIICDSRLGTTYCVLDGLDECDETIQSFLERLKTLFSMTSSKYTPRYLKLIIVSRTFPDFFPEILSGFPRVRLDPDMDNEIRGDIDRFIDYKINDLSKVKHYPESLRLHVKKTFRDRAQGTFLWVGIVAEELRKCRATQVEEKLEFFPAGLEGLYRRMLLQIVAERRETAARILRWVVMAVRPLSFSELGAAIIPTYKHSDCSDLSKKMEDQISYCGNFLTTKDREIRLVHQSAKDYLLHRSEKPDPELEIFKIWDYAANLELARTCFYYMQIALADDELDREEDTFRTAAFPLSSYAINH